MSKFQKPTVTIELDEYNELLKIQADKGERYSDQEAELMFNSMQRMANPVNFQVGRAPVNFFHLTWAEFKGLLKSQR